MKQILLIIAGLLWRAVVRLRMKFNIILPICNCGATNSAVGADAQIRTSDRGRATPMITSRRPEEKEAIERGYPPWRTDYHGHLR